MVRQIPQHVKRHPIRHTVCLLTGQQFKEYVVDLPYSKTFFYLFHWTGLQDCQMSVFKELRREFKDMRLYRTVISLHISTSMCYASLRFTVVVISFLWTRLPSRVQGNRKTITLQIEISALGHDDSVTLGH